MRAPRAAKQRTRGEGDVKPSRELLDAYRRRFPILPASEMKSFVIVRQWLDYSSPVLVSADRYEYADTFARA